MRCAWIWPSSWGGVSQISSIGTPVRPDRSFAAVSAPRRADRNTGFVELFAIIAIRIGFVPAIAAGPPPPALSPVPAGVDFFGQPVAASAPRRRVSDARRSALPITLGISLRETARGEPGARLIKNHRDHDGAADDDPLIVLVEVQGADRLSDEDNEDGSQHRVDRAPPTAAQTSTSHDRGSDHV